MDSFWDRIGTVFATVFRTILGNIRDNLRDKAVRKSKNCKFVI